MLNKIILIIIILLSYLNYSYNRKLVFVYTQTRHGSRAPLSIDSNYKDYFNFTWTNPEELLNSGCRQHYILGMHLKNRYINSLNFLNKTFNPKEILIESTDKNRTISSALSLLQGLFPFQTGKNITYSQQNYSIPPIQKSNISKELQEQIDNLLKQNYSLPLFQNIIPLHNFIEVECSKKKEYIRNYNVNHNKFILNYTSIWDKKYKQKLQNLFKDIYQPIENFNFLTYYTISDQFLSNLNEGRNMSFIEKYDINFSEFYNDCLEIAMISLKYRDNGDENGDYTSYRSSNQFKELIYYIKKIVYNDMFNINELNTPKFLLLSAHDSTLTPLQIRFSQLFNCSYKNPVVSSFIFIEVYKKDEKKINNLSLKDYEVDYYFNDEFIKTIDLDVFIDGLFSVIWDEDKLEEFCEVENIEKKQEKEINKYFFSIIILSSILMTNIIVIIIISICLSTNNPIKENIFNNLEEILDEENNNNIIIKEKEENNLIN